MSALHIGAVRAAMAPTPMAPITVAALIIVVSVRAKILLRLTAGDERRQTFNVAAFVAGRLIRRLNIIWLLVLRLRLRNRLLMVLLMLRLMVVLLVRLVVLLMLRATLVTGLLLPAIGLRLARWIGRLGIAWRIGLLAIAKIRMALHRLQRVVGIVEGVVGIVVAYFAFRTIIGILLAELLLCGGDQA